MKKSKPKNIVEKKPKVKKKTGRTLLYVPETVLPRLEKLAKDGLNNKQIAKSFGITETTFYDWSSRFPEFSLSLNKYRGLADIQVENALFKSAVGFDFVEEKHVRKKTGAKYTMVLTETVKKHQTGNATAQIFYLKNRMPDRYRDKIETEISIPVGMESITFTAKRREG
jgi:hypothetical protein